MHYIQSNCGCFTNKRIKVQGKCAGHAGNKAYEGFTKVLVDEMPACQAQELAVAEELTVDLVAA
jgi:hypothetical protein